MTDFYTLYSAELTGLTDDEIAWVKKRLGELDEEQMFDHEIFRSLGSNTIWFFSEDYGNPENVGMFVSEFLEKFRPNDIWYMQWADTCNRTLPDAFGGGAMVVTAKEVRIESTSDVVQRLLAEVKPETQEKEAQNANL